MPLVKVHKIDWNNAIALRFKTEEVFRKANMITVTRGRGHQFRFPGRHAIIMDKEDQDFFKELEGLYEEEKVAKPGEVSHEGLLRLRNKYRFGTG